MNSNNKNFILLGSLSIVTDFAQAWSQKAHLMAAAIAQDILLLESP